VVSSCQAGERRRARPVPRAAALIRQQASELHPPDHAWR
jgi:hypothetical protein